MRHLKTAFPYILFALIAGVVVFSNVPGETPSLSPASGAQSDDRVFDLVCSMEVNTAWGFSAQHGGKAYHFCAQRCQDLFEADELRYLQDRCLVCDSRVGETFPATYLGKTYPLCSEEHRRVFKDDPAAYFLHTMWGIPPWLYYASIALILIASFAAFDLFGRRRSEPRGAAMGTKAPPPGAAVPALSADRFNLFTFGWLKAAARSRVFRFSLQAVVTVLFLLIIAAGIFGNQNPALNIAPLLTWTVWWGFLVILILFAGKLWCYVCPWDAIAGWTEKLAFWRKNDDGLSLELRWPRVVRNISIAAILFIGLTWIELGFGVTMKPRVTAYLAIAMLLLAVLSAMLFDRKSFCRYGCLVGRVSGLYALFSGVEVRPNDPDACARCHSKECVKGSETAYGCPTFLYPGGLKTNTYCIQCMECVQACPHDNLAFNLRPWGSDLAVEGKPRTDEAYLALLMLSITGFHGLTMTPAWGQLIDAIREFADWGRIVGFTTGMAVILLAPVMIYAALVAVSRKLGARDARNPLSYKDYFIRYAYALLPIALFYHIAHNLEHLLMEGPKVVALMSDPFGWNWDLFGTASWSIPPLISLEHLWLVQVLLVLVGHVYSLWVAQKTSLRLFGSSRAAFRSQLPMLAGMILFSIFSLWLLKQPMEMRTSSM